MSSADWSSVSCSLHNDYTKELMVKLIREIIAGLC
eukprot:COSAG06_NODE_14922_length_1114_cov_2.180296_1_plen_34_part_10